MQVNKDFRDLFAALNDANAEYLLVGGYAFAFHAYPRFTKDLDVLVRASSDNARKVYHALAVFGAPLDDFDQEELTDEEVVFQIGVPPNRIDILTSISGVSFSDAWKERLEDTYGDQPIHIIGRRHLLENKLAAGRPRDLVDAQELQKLEDRESEPEE